MPWKDTEPAKEQRDLVQAWHAGGVSVAVLARRFGVSRKTAHKWIARFKRWGWEGLGDRSRAPHSSPTRTPAEVCVRLVAAKLAHRTWGPKKLLPWLAARCPGMALPGLSTAGEILQRCGLVRPRRRVRRTAPWNAPFADVRAPNDVWCIDLKGWFRTGDGRRCDPLTVSDAHSRYCLACQGVARPRYADVQRVLARVFRQYGLPRAIRTDNGPPFASVGLGSLSELAVWWIKLGIVPERIAPAHPEQNGRHERLHRTLKADTATPPAPTLRAQQRAFNRFVQVYNHERPHEALGQRPPADVYQPSPRPYPAHVSAPSYPAPFAVRRVRSNGEIKWHGRTLFVSAALRGEPLGLEPIGQGLWALHFGPLRIGMLDERTQRVVKTPVHVSPMSSV